MSGSGLQKVLFDCFRAAFWFLENAENGTDADVHVDVAGAVERVEHQQVFAFRILTRYRKNLFHFFRCHGGQVSAPFIGLDQNLVGNHVEFLLYFALYVFAARATQYTG